MHTDFLKFSVRIYPELSEGFELLSEIYGSFVSCVLSR